MKSIDIWWKWGYVDHEEEWNGFPLVEIFP